MKATPKMRTAWNKSRSTSIPRAKGWAVLISNEELPDRGRFERRGPPRAFRRDCPEESVRPPPAEGSTRREYPRPLRRGGRRVHHGGGRGAGVRLRGCSLKGNRHLDPCLRCR